MKIKYGSKSSALSVFVFVVVVVLRGKNPLVFAFPKLAIMVEVELNLCVLSFNQEFLLLSQVVSRYPESLTNQFYDSKGVETVATLN